MDNPGHSKAAEKVATAAWTEPLGVEHGGWRQSRRPTSRAPAKPQATKPEQIDAQVAAANQQLASLKQQLSAAIGHEFRVEDISWLRGTPDPKFAAAQELLRQHARWSLTKCSTSQIPTIMTV